MLVPILMRSSPCVRTSFTEAVTIMLEVYGPILFTRFLLRKFGRAEAAAPLESVGLFRFPRRGYGPTK